jgi:hypothetical protein
MEFNSSDIVEAHYWFSTHYHGGQHSRLYSRLCGIARYYDPGMGQCGPTTENGCMIYNALEEKYGYPVTPYEVLPCGKADLL